MATNNKVSKLPWPALDKFFSVQKNDGKNFRVKCNLCVPNKTLSCSVVASSNLQKHLRSIHPGRIEELKTARSKKRKMESSQLHNTKELPNYPVSQSTVDQLIIQYIIRGVQPLTILDKNNEAGASFIKLVQGLRPGASVISLNTFQARIDTILQLTKMQIRTKMAEVNLVSATTDYWSVGDIGYLGITAHWICPWTLESSHVALACRSINSSDKLVPVLQSVLEEYNLRNKVTAVTTNKGSHFFREDELYNRPLPPLFKCASYTLDLVATADIGKALAMPQIGKVSEQLFRKCRALWSKQSGSYKAPKGTGWRSTIKALTQMDTIISTTEGLDEMQNLLDSLQVPRFQDDDLSFLKEYVQVATPPLAMAIDLLQQESKMFTGYFLPIVHQLVRTLETVQAITELRFCLPVLEAIISGVLSRFQKVWWKKCLVVASCVHPRFKLDWILDEHKKREAYEWVIEEIRSCGNSKTSPAVPDEDSFFKFLPRVVQNGAKEDYDAFLNKPGFQLANLNISPELKKVFLKRNTTLPSNASVRMFRDLFENRRSVLDETNFENRLLIHLNPKFSLC